MFNTILVPLDGSELSESVLPKMVELTKCLPEAKFVLLEVISPIGSNAMSALAAPAAGEIQGVSEDEAVEYLRAISTKYLPKSNVQILVDEGEAATIILDKAKDVQADLIAMASHGRSGLARLTLGSVTARVISHAEVPVLVVKGH